MINKIMVAMAFALVASVTLGLGSSEARTYRKNFGWHASYNSAAPTGNYLRQRNRDYPRDRQLQGRL